ncbi:MAG: hypothetical protein J0M20_01300 [Burkholderiales bacterium]|nr:hypothetical protein [Burkholderiales bacterium]
MVRRWKLPARAGFAALAMAIAFTLLYSVGQVADQQYGQAQLAQAAAATHVAQATAGARG